MPEAMFIHRLGTLRPTDEDGRELLHGLSQDDLVRVKITKPRNMKFHRLFWKLMTTVHENLPDEKRKRYPTPELLVSWFKIATGHVDTFHIEGKGTVHIPRSISFAKMDEIEFGAFFARCCDLIASHFISGVSASQWRSEIEQMIGVTVAPELLKRTA